MNPGLLATTIFALMIGFPLASMAGLAPDDDGDGIENVNDNCTQVPNPTQCDHDNDGYGNHCDGDFNNDANMTPADFSGFFLPNFQANNDPTPVGTDMNCDGEHTPPCRATARR